MMILALMAFSILPLFLAGAAAARTGSDASPRYACSIITLPGKTLVSAPPSGNKGPDDITMMSVKGLDDGKPLLWTEYQNGVGTDGTPSSTGATQSLIAGYDPMTGSLMSEMKVNGHVDGLTADQNDGTLVATSNEDANSFLALIYPGLGTVATYTFSPNPAVSGNGGTDSIAILNDRIYVSHSNPNDLTQAATYLVSLDQKTLTAYLTPVFYDNSTAFSVNTRAKVQLALTDPDTNIVMPRADPRFAGTLATISQADGQIIFASHLNHNPRLSVLNVTDNIPGNVPPIDGLAVATSNKGTLYVVDASANTIQAFSTSGCQGGTVFVGEPKDNGNALVGTLNLSTGQITPFTNHFTSPKGLLFVPSDQSQGRQHDDFGQQGPQGNEE